MGKQIETPGYHVVEQGDWLAKIAHWYGIPDWKTIWNHGNNAAIKAQRKNPNIIFPGDRFFVPKIEPKSEPRPTNKTHRFVLERKMATLTIRILDETEKPRAGEKYTLVIQGWKEIQGNTDGNGQLHHEIPVTAEYGQLILERETVSLRIGQLDPIDEVSGVKGRLTNLGYAPGEIDDDDTTYEFKSAVMAHQQREKMELTGKLDAITRQKLEDKYQC